MASGNSDAGQPAAAAIAFALLITICFSVQIAAISSH
jgi:hypothetical protein